VACLLEQLTLKYKNKLTGILPMSFNRLGFISALLILTTFTNPGYSSQIDDDRMLTVQVPADPSFYRTLGQQMLDSPDGIFERKLSAIAQLMVNLYEPSPDEPTIQDLVYSLKTRGLNTEYWAAVKELADRGHPYATSYWAGHQVEEHMATKDADYLEGMALLAFCAAAGIEDACDSLGRQYRWSGNIDMAKRVLDRGTALPRCLFNRTVLTGAKDNPVESLANLTRAAEAGYLPAYGALVRRYSIYTFQQSFSEALKWFYIGYKGSICCDRYNGFEQAINFLNSFAKIGSELPGSIQKRAMEQAEAWLRAHPQSYTDGFGQEIVGSRPLQSRVKAPRFQSVDADSVQSLFEGTWMIGDKNSFSMGLLGFLEAGDANAFYMQSVLDWGYIWGPDWTKREKNLDDAYVLDHPLATLEYGLQRWIDGVTDRNGTARWDISQAYHAFKRGYDRWYNTPHRVVVGEITFFLGYFLMNGLNGHADPVQAQIYIDQAAELTPLALAYQARNLTDPVEKFARLKAAYNSMTSGDWFGSIDTLHEVQKTMSQAQVIEGTKRAKEILAANPNLSLNIYERLRLGLNPAFSGNNMTSFPMMFDNGNTIQVSFQPNTALATFSSPSAIAAEPTSPAISSELEDTIKRKQKEAIRLFEAGKYVPLPRGQFMTFATDLVELYDAKQSPSQPSAEIKGSSVLDHPYFLEDVRYHSTDDVVDFFN
jgi:hypothetical protein